MIDQVTVREFLAANSQSVFLRFHSQNPDFSGCSRMEFVGILHPSTEPMVCCIASPSEALEIIRMKNKSLFCWHTEELYTIQRYLHSVGIPTELEVTDTSEVLISPDFRIEAVEWRLIQRFALQGKTFEYLDLRKLVKNLGKDEQFASGFDLSEAESLKKTCQIARVVCCRWLNFAGLKIPGFFFFEPEKPKIREKPAPPVKKS
jgi:hypothetical protein